MVERLAIARLGSRGDGIADTAAGALYVPYTLPGETVEVDAWHGHADRRHLIKVDIASPDRIAPICPHFGICGGCALQHLATARYRDWKRGLVAEALAHYDPATAMVYVMHLSAVETVNLAGDDEQKRRLLPAVRERGMIATLAFSEPGTGGHFWYCLSQARRDGDDYILNKDSSWATSAGEADWYPGGDHARLLPGHGHERQLLGADHVARREGPPGEPPRGGRGRRPLER